MVISWDKIEPFLLQVEKPARYVGGEFNQIVKVERDVKARCCLAFPDVYEIGMSYHGFRILYERVNARAGWLAERAFAPWPDFEAFLRREKIPLYSLETRLTLAEFDWVGFTLQHEANLTNVLNMIDLAGLPLESAERDAPFPILIGGGEGAFSPEPLAPFLDAFAVGAGEELIIELMALFERARAGVTRGDWDRARILRELDAIEGIYVPCFWSVDYHADGAIAAVRRVAGEPGGGADTAPVPPPATEDSSSAPAFAPLASHSSFPLDNPPLVRKRRFDIARDLGSVAPVVPLMKTVHDRLVIEIRRGCASGCRFCQAGMINRPVNERPLEQIVEIARRGLTATGYDGISLLSLSSSDYSLIAPLIRRLGEEFGGRGVSVSLPSLRINGFDIHLVDELVKGRKSNFTFAPEAGTERLRQVINKPVDQKAFFEIIEDVFRRGWRTVKFYFMIGLPTETDADLDGIVEICERAAELGRRHHGRKATVNVTLSPLMR
ncbi:MAG: radical SAM protein, partial [bacterium]|nr:radical SAM protein [bacterium]